MAHCCCGALSCVTTNRSSTKSGTANVKVRLHIRVCMRLLEHRCNTGWGTTAHQEAKLPWREAATAAGVELPVDRTSHVAANSALAAAALLPEVTAPATQSAAELRMLGPVVEAFSIPMVAVPCWRAVATPPLAALVVVGTGPVAG